VNFVLLALFLFWQAAVPSGKIPVQQYSRYQRTIMPPAGTGAVCAVMDAPVFAHAASSLRDLRVYQGARELAYVITLSEPEQSDGETARVLNLGARGRSIVFDLQMPNRRYTDVNLDLAGKNYLATATVSGMDDPQSSSATHLGEFTLFDLTAQHLSRNTTLHLQESSFPYLHIVLTASPAPGTHGFTATPEMVKGAAVPPSREAQSLYTVVAESTAIGQRDHQTIASFSLPERVPVERVSFALSPDFKANFSRDVHISDRPAGTPESAAEAISGTIMRVHLNEAGREIRQQQMSVPAILGANLQSPATVQVAIDNGDDPPLPVTAIRLEMRQRKLCFSPSTTGVVTLFYGDPGLSAPQYDYTRFFSPTAPTRLAQLGPEQLNSSYQPRPDTRALTERYPDLLWIALLVVICILAVVALRSARTVHR